MLPGITLLLSVTSNHFLRSQGDSTEKLGLLGAWAQVIQCMRNNPGDWPPGRTKIMEQEHRVSLITAP